jgi:hypothetical protein
MRWAEPAATLLGMDSVRFGRALGVGARAAAKSLATAVDAANSPNPSPSATGPKSGAGDAARTTQQAQSTARVSQVIQTGQGLARGGRKFGESFWGQLKRLSGVLWLEFTGAFFGIFALYAASGVWKLRAALRDTPANHEAHVHLLLATGMTLLFGYFCVSSFVRASRRGKAR